MASSVQSLPNHYEVLGLSPTASDDEIRQAFARNMGMFGARPFAAAAQASLAFEVLRDPAKRREYDRLIGVAPKPAPEPYKWTFAVAPQRGLPFGPPLAPQAAPNPGAEPPLTPASAEAKRAEDKLASLIQSLRELSEPTAPRAPAPQPITQVPPQLQPDPVEAPAPRTPQFVTLELADDGPGRDFLRQDWRRPAFVLGGLLVGTGILGAVAGLSAGGDNSPAEAEPALTVAVPAPKPQPLAIAETTQQASAPADWPAPRAERQPTRAAPRQFAAAAIPQAAPAVPVGEPAVQPAATDPLAPQEEAPQAVAARLPLSNATIARTIGRIGYACGSVASATAVDGAPGTFNVTCTSGHSYRAAPVRGRYRFKRLG